MTPAGRSAPLTGRGLAITIAILAAAVAAVGLACSLFGHVRLMQEIWEYRLFGLAAGAVVGAGLAGGGMALQGLLRNPLAEPYILGISSGAGVGVLIGKVVLPSWGFTTPILAMIGALATCGVVYAIAQRHRRLDPVVLLLSGVIVNVFNGAIMFTVLLFAERNEILEYIHWSMGGVPQWIWSRPWLLAVCAGLVGAGLVALLLRSAAMNALGLGDEVAGSSGVRVDRLRFEIFAVVGLMTAAAVCLAGPVGFVGLIVPHICRLILGPDHRRLLIYSAALGAIFLMAADTFCRTVGPWMGTGKIPVGVVTALVGGPLFIVLLRRRLGGSAL